jgi:hypothetical protein
LPTPRLSFAKSHMEAGATALQRAIRHLVWLENQLPSGSEAAKRLERVAPHLRSGDAAYNWYVTLHEQACHNDSRRARTRNAIMHGGPLADRTVEAVVPFAEYMASEAVDLAMEAQLAGVDLVELIIERADGFQRLRRELKAGRPPGDVLFV